LFRDGLHEKKSPFFLSARILCGGGVGCQSFRSILDAEPANEDLTLLTLYALAGEESGGSSHSGRHFIHEISKAFFSAGPISSEPSLTGEVAVRELTALEMVRAERELWILLSTSRRQTGT